jgi:hypothetical protein
LQPKFSKRWTAAPALFAWIAFDPCSDDFRGERNDSLARALKGTFRLAIGLLLLEDRRL